jgi:hypothetical protein
MWLTTINLDILEKQIARLPPVEQVHLSNTSEANKELPNLPSFSYTFDELCNLLQTLPTQDVYGAYYLKSAVDNGCIEPDLFLRAKRNYLSLLREYHLFLLLRDKIKIKKLYFNRLLDALGYDLVIESRHKKYGIRSFVGTPFSYQKYGFKYGGKRAKLIQSFLGISEIIDLPITRSEARIVNGYWLYDEQEVYNILARRGIINGRH